MYARSRITETGISCMYRISHRTSWTLRDACLPAIVDLNLQASGWGSRFRYPDGTRRSPRRTAAHLRRPSLRGRRRAPLPWLVSPDRLAEIDLVRTADRAGGTANDCADRRSLEGCPDGQAADGTDAGADTGTAQGA